MTLRKLPKKVSPIRWRGLFFITIASAFLYILLEWLFVVTKPSYLSSIGWLEKSEILLFVSALAIGLSLLAVLMAYLLALGPLARSMQRQLFYLAAAIPAFVLAGLSLLLIDNFSYTLFNFGIIHTSRILRAIYGFGFLVVWFLLWQKMRGWSGRWGKIIFRDIAGWKLAAVVIILVGLALAIPFVQSSSRSGVRLMASKELESTSLPNIFLLTSDGLNAARMSVYGYERDTTPFLKSLTNESLVMENNFNNNAKTAGSIVSLLSSKYPADTRVVFPPDILRDDDAYQHLPGILKSMGYTTAQFGTNSISQNMLQGFMEVNGSKPQVSDVLNTLDEIFPGDSAYFIYDVFNRIFDRLRHIFFIKKMDDSILNLVEGSGRFQNYEHLHALFDLIEQGNQPIFVHLHWMGTHGDTFHVRNQIFSAGKDADQQIPWDMDFYDDAVLEFDDTVAEIVDKLEGRDAADNTILIIGSDHGRVWASDQRIPLIFHFPQGAYAQSISLNGQNLDIAPTVLDYLGVDRPDWMTGDSLLVGLNVQRPIFATDLKFTMMDESGIVNDPNLWVPPFYQFGRLSMVDCDNFYSLQLQDGFALKTNLVEGYSTPCGYSISSEHEALQLMIEHLKQNQFDTSSLEQWANSR